MEKDIFSFIKYVEYKFEIQIFKIEFSLKTDESVGNQSSLLSRMFNEKTLHTATHRDLYNSRLRIPKIFEF